MVGSLVFTHYEFLRELGGETDEQIRILHVRMINTNLRALCKIIALILNNTVPTLSYDRRIFRENRNVLRHLVSLNISLIRKKRTL